MIASLHQQEDAPELREVLVLSRLERVLHEEWDDALSQMLELADSVGHPVSVAAANYATAEELLQTVQNLHIALVLHDSELRKYLIADFHLCVSRDTDVKAAFTIHEACHPSCI